MKRALILASVASMIDQFNMQNIALLQEMGCQVHVAANFVVGNTCDDARIKVLQSRLDALGVSWHQIDFARNALNLVRNAKAYKQVKTLLKQGYDLIHCHSPIGGVVTRLAAQRYRKMGTRVLYTAHGFHFYNGAPLMNWLIYYPIEKFFSRWTDVLITINQEDYARAQKKFRAKKIVYIPGVGVDTERFATPVSKEVARKQLGLAQDAIVLLTVGELNENKNQSVVLEAMAKLGNPNLQYLLCGQGDKEEQLRQRAEELGLAAQVHLLGYRKDLPQIYPAADIYLCPSYREGLNVSVMEAMLHALPVVCSDIRGNRDMILREQGGFLCDPKNYSTFVHALGKLTENETLRMSQGAHNAVYVTRFTAKAVLENIKELY